MGYIIIELPITKEKGYSIVDFDKKKYQVENEVTLIGEPLSFEKKASTITIIFEGFKGKRKTSSISIAR